MVDHQKVPDSYKYPARIPDIIEELNTVTWITYVPIVQQNYKITNHVIGRVNESDDPCQTNKYVGESIFPTHVSKS